METARCSRRSWEWRSVCSSDSESVAHGFYHLGASCVYTPNYISVYISFVLMVLYKCNNQGFIENTAFGYCGTSKLTKGNKRAIRHIENASIASVKTDERREHTFYFQSPRVRHQTKACPGVLWDCRTEMLGNTLYRGHFAQTWIPVWGLER